MLSEYEFIELQSTLGLTLLARISAGSLILLYFSNLVDGKAMDEVFGARRNCETDGLE